MNPMETPASRQGFRLETLGPPMPSLSRFPSFAPRRSHLDSDSYRTLVRIFSHCIDGSLLPPQLPRSSTDPNPRSEASRLEEPKCQSAEDDTISDRNGIDNSAIEDELGHGRRGEGHAEDCGHELSKDASCPNPRFGGASDGNFASVEELWHGEGHRGDARAETSGESGHGDGLKEHDGFEDGGTRNGQVSASPEIEQVRHGNSVEPSKNDESADSGLMNDLLFDNPELTDGLDDILYSFEELLHEENNELQKDAVIINPESHDSSGRTSSLSGNSKFGKSQEGENGCVSSTFPKVPMTESSKSIISRDERRGSPEEIQGRETRQEEQMECFYSEAAKEMVSEKNTIEEDQVEASQPVKEIQGLQQEMNINSDLAVCCFGSRNLDKHQVSPLRGLVNNGEIEEGEIPDEVQVLADQKLEEGLVCDGFVKKGNPDHTLATFSNIGCIDGHIGLRENKCKEEECNFPIYNKKDGIGLTSTDDRVIKPQLKKYSNEINANAKSQAVVTDAFGLLKENSENLAILKNGKPSEQKDVEGKAKKKRGPSTEERKAKKKSAKKRKRAQMAREQGVKRLKLQPIVKPKEVKYCNFFMVGRCQQGELCKFSHDTTPLTKSQPCKYFACDSCLKGEDCPFDHELSKYPCHNYMSKGMCSRGDRCKFSHKMSIIEGSSTSTRSKSDSPLSSGKQLNTNSTFLVANDPPKNATSSAPFSMNKHLEVNSVMRLKGPVQVPEGIRFLSFGKGPSNSPNKHDKLLLEKHGGIKICNQENQEKFLAVGHKNALNSEQKTLVTAQSESKMKLSGSTNVFASKELKNNSFSNGPVVAPFSRSLQSEVSDATKLLEEFLFIGGS